MKKAVALMIVAVMMFASFGTAHAEAVPLPGTPGDLRADPQREDDRQKQSPERQPQTVSSFTAALLNYHMEILMLRIKVIIMLIVYKAILLIQMLALQLLKMKI